MTRILFVSYNHAKQNVADSVQNHRLIGALKDYYDIDILQRASRWGNEGVWSPNIYLLDRVVYKLMPCLVSVFSFDAYLWSAIAYRKERVRLPKYDAVVMVYGPYQTRFFQYKAWKNNHSKIISLLYDPFYDNIFMNQGKIGRWLREKIEKKIVRESATIVVNNKKLLNIFKERYDCANVCLVNLCGREDIQSFIPEQAKTDRDASPKILIHCGNVYGERRIDELNEVITQLRKRREYLASELKIIVLGTYCVGYEKVEKSGNQDIITRHDPLYGDELVSCMRRADGYVLIDPMDAGNTCFPSKLCEYYQYEKPIFGFAAKGTPSYDSLIEAGHTVIDSNEIGTMVEALSSFIIGNASNIREIDMSFGAQFNPATVAKELDKIICNIR